MKGRPKRPICGVALILRHCGVQCTPRSKGFRAPCTWTFLNGLRNVIVLAKREGGEAKPGSQKPAKEK